MQVDKDGTCRPVLLDFGMCITLSEEVRQGYCELLQGMADLSISQVSSALRKVGYQNTGSDANPERDIQFFMFLMRDTGSRESQRADAQDFHALRQDQKGEDKKKALDTQQEVVNRTLKALPNSLIFLLRVIGLLRGLGTTMGVQVSMMDILQRHAKKALIEKVPMHLHATQVVPQSPQGDDTALSPVEALIDDLFTKDSLKGGVQVCVVKRGKVVVECCGGTLGVVNPRGVKTSTKFPLLDLTKAISVLATLKGLQGRKLSVDWVNARLAVSFKDVLMHKACGLEDSVPLNSNITLLEDLEACLTLVKEFVVEVGGSQSQEEHASMYSLSQGYCLSVMLEELGLDLQELIEEITHGYEVYVGGLRTEEEVAEVSHGYAAIARDVVLNNGRGRGKDVQGKDMGVQEKDIGVEEKDTGGKDTEVQEKDVGVQRGGSMGGEEEESVGRGINGRLSIQESKNDPTLPGGSKQENTSTTLSFSLPGRILFDPSLVNDPRIKAAFVPSFNGYASASQFATLLNSHDLSFVGSSSSVVENNLLMGGALDWGVGFNLASDGWVYMNAFGGSLLMHNTQLQVSIVVLVSDLTLNREFTRLLVHEVLPKVLSMDVPKIVV